MRGCLRIEANVPGKRYFPLLLWTIMGGKRLDITGSEIIKSGNNTSFPGETFPYYFFPSSSIKECWSPVRAANRLAFPLCLNERASIGLYKSSQYLPFTSFPSKGTSSLLLPSIQQPYASILSLFSTSTIQIKNNHKPGSIEKVSTHKCIQLDG